CGSNSAHWHCVSVNGALIERCFRDQQQVQLDKYSGRACLER
ncbi:MAG: hypothetical protein ACI9CV_000970, partial [Ilumatobacter sp.]